MRLTELTDRPYEYYQTVRSKDRSKYVFETEAGLIYEVLIYSRDPVKLTSGTAAEVHFSLKDTETGKLKSAVQGTGDAVRVISTVINIVKDYVAKNSPATLTIIADAESPSHVKLYRRMASRVSSGLPQYELISDREISINGRPAVQIDLGRKAQSPQ